MSEIILNPSIGNPKLKKISDGASLYLITRMAGAIGVIHGGRRELRTKLLGSAADKSPAAARRAREDIAVERRAGNH